MASIWLAAAGMGVALWSVLYAGETITRFAAVGCLLLGAFAMATEGVAYRRGRSPWAFTRRLRLGAAAGTVVVGAALLAFPSTPRSRLEQVVWMAAGAGAAWTLLVLLVWRISGTRDFTMWPHEVSGDGGAAQANQEVIARQRISPLDRVVIGFFPFVTALYLIRTMTAWVAASILVACLVAVTLVWWAVEVILRPWGRKMEPPSSTLTFGIIWIFLGQVVAVVGQHEGNSMYLRAGWLVTGAGVGFTVWLWQVRPMLIKLWQLRAAWAEKADSVGSC